MYGFRFVNKWGKNVLLIKILLIGFYGCSDHKTSVSLDFPGYTPQLVVYSAVGPVSGGAASVKWSRPLAGQSGEPPAVPAVSVFLVGNGERIQKFNTVPDSAGYFLIPPGLLELSPEIAYAIEIVFEESGDRLFSTESYLPPEPVFQEADAYYDPDVPGNYALFFTLAPEDKKTGAFSFFPSLIDESGCLGDETGLAPYIRSPEFTYATEWGSDGKGFSRRYRREIKCAEVNGDEILAEKVKIKAAFLSKELAAFKEELDDLSYLDEFSSQTGHPEHSNIIGAVGVFGMYNEASLTVPIKE